jgi:hypothetical protein
MVPPELTGAVWRKSSHSPTQSECVELAALPGHLAVRDSKNPEAGAVILTRGQGHALLHRLKNDQPHR